MIDDTLRTAASMLPLFIKLDKHIAFVVVCCHTPDMPIIFASKAFYELTLYAKEQVLGSNCRFLQGLRTSRQQVRPLSFTLEQ